MEATELEVRKQLARLDAGTDQLKRHIEDKRESLDRLLRLAAKIRAILDADDAETAAHEGDEQ